MPVCSEEGFPCDHCGHVHTWRLELFKLVYLGKRAVGFEPKCILVDYDFLQEKHKIDIKGLPVASKVYEDEPDLKHSA